MNFIDLKDKMLDFSKQLELLSVEADKLFEREKQLRLDEKELTDDKEKHHHEFLETRRLLEENNKLMADIVLRTENVNTMESKMEEVRVQLFNERTAIEEQKRDLIKLEVQKRELEKWEVALKKLEVDLEEREAFLRKERDIDYQRKEILDAREKKIDSTEQRIKAITGV